MNASPDRPRIAIINSNEDLLGILKDHFEEEGYMVATAHARAFRLHPERLEPFVTRADPQVLIWDLAPPYDENWRFFQHIRQLPVMRGRRFVLTSTNEQQVHKVADMDERVIEIVGKPFDLDHLVQVVERARRGAPRPES